MHNVSAQASHQRNEDDFRMETQVQELDSDCVLEIVLKSF